MKPVKGGKVGGKKDPFSNLDRDLRARLRAGQLHRKAFSFEKGNEDLFKTLGDLPYDQFLELRSAAADVQNGVRAIKGKGFSDTLGFLRDVDLSSVAPLRNAAGLSKGQLVDRVLDETKLSKAEKAALKGILYFKSFKNGGKL